MTIGPILKWHNTPLKTPDQCTVLLHQNKADLVFCDTVIRHDYTVVSHLLGRCQRQPTLELDHLRKLIHIVPSGLPGGGRAERVFEALYSVTNGLMCHKALGIWGAGNPAGAGIFAALSFVDAWRREESKGLDLGPLVQAMENSFREMAKNVEEAVKHEIIEQDRRAICSMAENAAVHFANSRLSPSRPEYEQQAYIAAVDSRSKLMQLPKHLHPTLIDLYVGLQTILYNIHFGRAQSQGIGELQICREIASTTFEWLKDYRGKAPCHYKTWHNILENLNVRIGTNPCLRPAIMAELRTSRGNHLEDGVFLIQNAPDGKIRIVDQQGFALSEYFRNADSSKIFTLVIHEWNRQHPDTPWGPLTGARHKQEVDRMWGEIEQRLEGFALSGSKSDYESTLFTQVPCENRRIALKTPSGRFVILNPDGTPTVGNQDIATAEKFVVEQIGPEFSHLFYPGQIPIRDLYQRESGHPEFSLDGYECDLDKQGCMTNTQ